ncbi:hypothetical protein BCEP4_1440007 [Burkholderia cepacia]|nr:hypothetical protein BCEP4_1440007 [Burkholderia cepacia]
MPASCRHALPAGGTGVPPVLSPVLPVVPHTVPRRPRLHVFYTRPDTFDPSFTYVPIRF